MLSSRAMSILRPALKQELAQFIRDKFPVTRKRSAFWFFTNEFKSNLLRTSTASNVLPRASSRLPPSSSADEGTAGNTREPVVKVSRNRIMQIWRNMDPESKRKYFNMAEFDEVRYEEQKSLWVSEVGALLHKYQDINKVKDLAPTHEELQEEFLESLDKLHKNYEQMIQTESTKMLYRDAIKRVNIHSTSLETTELISALPKHHKSILSKPRRPPAAFALFAMNNMERFIGMRNELRTKDTHLKLASKEWARMSKEEKQPYEDRYNELKEIYDEAMEHYRVSINQSSDDYLEMASREKKSFKKSIRRRLRKSSVLPLSIRNPFNFFVMEHKDSKLSALTEIWRNMSPEEKLKYVKLNEEDTIRYNREIEAYNEIKKSLNDMVSRTKSYVECEVDEPVDYPSDHSPNQGLNQSEKEKSPS